MRLTACVILGVLVLASTGGDLVAGEEYAPDLGTAIFADGQGNPLPVDHRYMPLTPGTRLLYEGMGADGPIFQEVLVSYETKEIIGVTCVVVEHWEWLLDEVSGEWKLVEETYDWFAQDAAGNVWYFGEDTREYDDADDWDTSEGGSWEAGVDGAEPGIIMPASPQVGIFYRQEHYPGVAEDMGKVLQLNSKVSVAYGNHRGCLKTKEWTPLEPGAVESKYYAKDLGLVLVRGPKNKNYLVELIDVQTF